MQVAELWCRLVTAARTARTCARGSTTPSEPSYCFRHQAITPRHPYLASETGQPSSLGALSGTTGRADVAGSARTALGLTLGTYSRT